MLEEVTYDLIVFLVKQIRNWSECKETTSTLRREVGDGR